jgi:hypothetical protein
MKTDHRGFTRAITFTPAFDRRNPDPKKDYGIHGAECHFSLSKDGKGVSFCLFTNWMLPHVQAETDARTTSAEHRYLFHKPQPAGVSYHDTKPHYEEQRCREDCDVTGGKCYSDSSYTMGDEFFKVLVEKGSEGLWLRLEELYNEWLVKEDAS